MNVQTRTKLYETLRAVLKERSDHDINDDDQREVVLDDLVTALEREFHIRAIWKQTINVTVSAYEGDNFPDVDKQFRDFVHGALQATYPGAHIEVSTAREYKVMIDGEPKEDLAKMISGEWWDAFCIGAGA